MANPEHVAKIRKGVKVWNEWRTSNPADINLSGANLTGSDLGEVNLSGAKLRAANLYEADLRSAILLDADLSETNLSGAELTAANLRFANLSRAFLLEANLTNANLSGAHLIGADIRNANLSGANLRGTELSGAYFNGADLRKADIRDAKLGWTTFANTNLNGTIGLELCKHAGPSTIGIDTIVVSRGQISERFLKSCGVPKQFITYSRSLSSQAVEFYSCFISYSTEDFEFANRIHADLERAGVSCWFAPHDIAGGRKIHEQIDEAIRVYDRLLLIVSEHSMKSSWVETEISKVRKRELKEKRQMLFPVGLVGYQALQDWECFDADTGKDSAREIREYFIPDFSNWKDHDSYSKAFERLLRDLKAESSA